MQRDVEVPEEAVVAADAAMCELRLSLPMEEPPTPKEQAEAAAKAAAPAIRSQERQRVREMLVQHAGEWALRMIRTRPTTTDDWAELRRLFEVADFPDTDDLCTCGHVRHEHHTWNENASVGCGHCPCEQFHLDLAALDSNTHEEAGRDD